MPTTNDIDNTNPTEQGRGRRLLIGAVVGAIVVLVVVLHLTGVIGANAHR
jgi:uncharacterized RDD family membrane protein YckC